MVVLPPDGWKDRRSACAEADPRRPRRRAPGPKDHRVAVLEERPRLAARETNRLLAADRKLEERARLLLRGAGLGAGSEQVPRLETTAIHRVVSHHLRNGPV